MNATKTSKIEKLQAFADTLDLYKATVVIGTNDHDLNVVWLTWGAIGCDRVRSRACGLIKGRIADIKARMKEVEASVLEASM